MTTVVTFPDIELWAATYLRSRVPAARADRRWPAHDAATTGVDIVVRDDSGPDGQVLATRRLGVNVLGAEGAQQAARDTAELVAALIRAAPEDLSTPVTAVTVRGPYAVESDTHRPCYYLTADLRVIGTTITV